MIVRPTDSSGDILPVISSADLLRGVNAEAELTRDRLNLYAGDWWENRSRGNEIVKLLQETRLTEADAQSVSSYIASYIRETPGVVEVRDQQCSITGRQFRFSCTIDTKYGFAPIHYEL